MAKGNVPQIPRREEITSVSYAMAIALALDIPLSTIGRDRRKGELRFDRRGRQVLITGGNLLDWLTPSPALAPHPNSPTTPTPAR